MLVLIVEDEARIAEFMKTGLREEGFDSLIAPSGENALDIMRDKDFAALIIDLMLPGIDGIELCRRFRESGVTAPILMLTAKDKVSDKITGLNAGADDYMTKPFEFGELLARLRALLRKTQGYQRSVLSIGDMRIDPNTKSVDRGGRSLALSKKEYALLEYLARNQDRICTRAMISRAVWDNDTNMYTNIIDVFVTHLRKKVDEDFAVKLIHTMRGKGFMLSADPQNRE